MANQTILNVAHPWTFQTQVVMVCLLLSCNCMSNKTTNQISTYRKNKKKQELDEFRQKYVSTVIDRIMEMKKRFGAAVSEKGWGPKPRQKIL